MPPCWAYFLVFNIMKLKLEPKYFVSNYCPLFVVPPTLKQGLLVILCYISSEDRDQSYPYRPMAGLSETCFV